MYSWQRGNNHKKPHPQGLEIPSPVADVMDCYQYHPAPPESNTQYWPKPFNVALVRVKRAGGSYAWEVVSHPQEGKLKDILRTQSKSAQGYKVFVLYTGINKDGMERVEGVVRRHQGKNPPEGYDSVLSHQTAKDVDRQVDSIRREITRSINRWNLDGFDSDD